MRYHLAVLLLLFYAPVLCGQDLVPHPYAFAGGEGMGAGYAPVAILGGAGLRVDSKHMLLDTDAWYDNGHKKNDGQEPNPKGHDRGLVGSAYFRLPSGWSFGGGVRWSQLSTTNYVKSALRPTLGGSKDYFHSHCRIEKCATDFSMRLGLDYLLKGSDWQNGLQGPLMTLFIPSPSVKGHIFYRETLGIYRFYDTVTDRVDPLLTREQMSNHHWDSFAEFTIMYRF